MTREPTFRTRRNILRTTASQAVLQQAFTLRLTLISVPFIFGFRTMGAAPIVALLAGLGVGLLGGVRWLLPKSSTLDAQTHRGVLLAGGGMLMVACGVQTLVWRLNLHIYAAGRLLIVSMIALMLVFLLAEAMRATFQRAWQRIQK